MCKTWTLLMSHKSIMDENSVSFKESSSPAEGRVGMLDYILCYIQFTTLIISSHLFGSRVAIFEHELKSSGMFLLIRAFFNVLPKLSSCPPRFTHVQSVSFIRSLKFFDGVPFMSAVKKCEIFLVRTIWDCF